MAAARPVVVASARGQSQIAPSTVVITKATAANMTLGTPTTAQNGTIIHISGNRRRAHGAAATIGFNAGDAAKDTAASAGPSGTV